MRKQLFLTVISVIVAVLIFEIILRVIGFSFPYYMRIDPVTGFALRENAEGFWQEGDRKSHFKINRDGFRDKLHSKEKSEDVIRIAVLGDSYTEARNVNIEDAYWSVMENELDECADKKVEVMNFGMSGFSTSQEYLLLKSRVWDFEPDVVILSFLSGNDVRENSKELNNNKKIPYFHMIDGGLELDESFKETLAFKKSQTTAYQVTHMAINNLRTLQIFNKIRLSMRHQKLKEGDPGLDTEIYSESTDPKWEEAWRITEEIIKKMSEEVKSHNSKFVIVTLTNGVQVRPENKSDLNYPERRISKLGISIGVPVITLAPKFIEYAKANNAYLHGFDDSGEGHWNLEGNRLAGEIIAEEMCLILR